MFGITCCGASISKDLKLSIVGDFFGNIRVFTNTKNPEVLCTFNIGDSSRYVHFHDYINNMAFVGCFSGNLNVLKLSENGQNHEVKSVYSPG